MRSQLTQLVPRPVGPVFLDPEVGWVVSRHADVTAVLSDSRYAVPEADSYERPGTLAWLRGMVCRFSEGPVHDRRRAIARSELARVDPRALDQEARDRTNQVLDRAGGDVTATVAREVPIDVLGRALGVTDLRTLTDAVPAVAADYLSPGVRPEAADAAVATLADLLGPGPDELVANRIALLVQAYEATARLIGDALINALRALDPPRWPPGSIVDETLRCDPPVRTMRRVTVAEVELCGHVLAAGTGVVLDVAAANRDPAVFVTEPDRFDPARGEPAHLTFGSGRRPCPGASHATHLAAGAVGAIVPRCRLGWTDSAVRVVAR